MDDKVEIKDLTQGEPTNTDWLIYQSSSDDEVYKAPKSDVEGEDAYVYIAYADDEDGNGFTNTFSETKDYVAILSTNTEIPSPAASDFSGLWKNYKGAKGNAATATAGTTTTLSAGQSAKVTNVGSTSSAVFKFEIPRGDKGEKGDNGAKIITAEFVGNDLHFNLDDGTEAILVGAKVDLKGIQGNTGASVVDAEVSGDDIVFTKSDGTTIKIENILIELKGDTGNGISGIEKTSTVGLVDTYTITYDDETTKTFDVTNGAKGDTGDNATVDAGTTTTGEAGTEASVVNSGTTSDAIFDFTIPKGDKGDTGNGIASIAKTGTSGLTDTYTITFTDETTTTFDVVNGEKGDNAYIYIAYASDDSGADFTTTFSSALDYIAILATYTEIETPEASDFAGLWKKYKGEKGDTGERGLNWINEEYSGATTYNVDDALLYNGSSYRCILESTGNLPTNTNYWSIIAQKGVDGEGAGDMLASVYDPTSVAGDAFDMDNMVEGTNNKLVSSAEKTAWNDKLDDITGESIADLSDVDAIAGITDGKVLKWSTDKFVVADDDDTTYTASDFDIKDLTDSTNLMTTWSGKQDSLGFTPEKSANKKTDLTDNSDTYYPSQKAVKTYADGKVYNGIRNGTTTSAPSEDAVYDALAGKQATLTFGIANTNAVKIDHASVVDNDYARFTASGLEGRSATEVRSDIGAQANLGYTAENSANKKTSLADNSDTYYPTQKAVKTAVDAKQDALGFTPENSANKKTDLTDNSDTYYPTQKAVKTAVDTKQATLVSGTNIKTINSQSLLGSGNINTPNTTYTSSDFDIKDLTDSNNLRTTWSGKQDALGFTPEDVDNKRTSFQATPDDSHYISEKLAKDSLDAKMTNPMTTQGDIIYGGASGLPTRLANGTAGKVLTMNSGATAPEWQNSLSKIAPQQTIPTSSSTDYFSNSTNAIYSSDGNYLYMGWQSGDKHNGIWRFTKDQKTGLYVYTDSVSLYSTYADKYISAPVIIGNYIYVTSITDSSAKRITRLNLDLTSPVIMTIGVADIVVGQAFTDGTYMYVFGSTNIATKYSISGTTMTKEGTITFTSAGDVTSCFYYNGYVYTTSDSSKSTHSSMYKYNISGGTMISSLLRDKTSLGGVYTGGEYNRLGIISNEDLLVIGFKNKEYEAGSSSTITGYTFELKIITMPSF